MHWVLLILLIPTLASAGGNTFPSNAGYQDPKECSTNFPTICADPTTNTALDAFPYWNNIMWRDGANSLSLALGVYNGYLLITRCQHCGIGTEACFMFGPNKGQCFDLDSVDAVTGWRQFATTDGVVVGTGASGDILHRLLPKTGEIMPTTSELENVEVLPPWKVTDVPDSTLMLGIGGGRVTMSKTKASFKECATATAGGNPGTSGCDGNGEGCDTHACCYPDRTLIDGDGIAQRNPYDYSGGTFNCSTPLGVASGIDNNGGSGVTARACYGGDGEYSTCDAAGLTYIQPTWDYSNTYDGDEGDPNATTVAHWSLFEFNKHKWENVWERGGSMGASAMGRSDWRDYESNDLGEVTGHCTNYNLTTREYTPPTNQTNMHHDCLKPVTAAEVPATGSIPGGAMSVSKGDSGGPTFIWFENKWWFMQGGASRSDGGANDYQREWSRWKTWTGQPGGSH